MNVQVRLTSSLGPSLGLDIDNFIRTTKLPSSFAPYSMALSASANGLWSSIRSSFSLFIIIISSKKREDIYEGFLKQPLLFAWTRGLSGLAPFLDESVVSSSVHFSPYIYPPPPSFFPISLLLIFREGARHSKNFAHVILLILLPLLSSFCCDRYFSRNHLLYLVSHLFFYFLLSFIFVFLVYHLTFLERPLT